MEILHARRLRVLLQVLDEAVRGERLPWLSRAIMPSPERRVCLQRVHPPGGRQVIQERLFDLRLSDFAAAVVAALGPIGEDQGLIEVYIFSPERDDFASSQARRQVHQKQRVISLPHDVVFARPLAHGTDQSLYFFVRHRLDALRLVRLRGLGPCEPRGVSAYVLPYLRVTHGPGVKGRKQAGMLVGRARLGPLLFQLSDPLLYITGLDL